jgi:hypothetical protein
MKPSSTVNALRIVFCIGAFVAIFYKPLGLPQWAADVGIGVGFVSALMQLWIRIRVKRHGEITPNPVAARRGTRIALSLIVVVTLSSPFWLQYTGITLGFSQLVISAFVTCALAIAALLLGVWFRRRV